MKTAFAPWHADGYDSCEGIDMPAQMYCEQCGGLVFSATGIPSLAKRCMCASKPGDSTIITKVCIQCGRDVSNDRRMKDPDGKYWCVECGEADHNRRHPEMANCADCHMRWPISQIKTLDGMSLCDGCYQIRVKTRASLERRFGRRKWWSYGVGIGLGAAALIGGVAWVIKAI